MMSHSRNSFTFRNPTVHCLILNRLQLYPIRPSLFHSVSHTRTLTHTFSCCTLYPAVEKHDKLLILLQEGKFSRNNYCPSCQECLRPEGCKLYSGTRISAPASGDRHCTLPWHWPTAILTDCEAFFWNSMRECIAYSKVLTTHQAWVFLASRIITKWHEGADRIGCWRG